jgi:hypothetical protein
MFMIIKRECFLLQSVRRKNENKKKCDMQTVHQSMSHHYEGGLVLPRRTTNDLAGGASEGSPVPDTLALALALANG